MCFIVACEEELEAGGRRAGAEAESLHHPGDGGCWQWMPLTSSLPCFNVKFLMGVHHLIRGIDNCTVP